MPSKESKSHSTSKRAENSNAVHDGGPWWGFIERTMAHADDLGAVALGVMALVTLLGLLGLTHGGLVDSWVGLLKRWLGLGSFLFPLAMLWGVIALFNHSRGRPFGVNWGRVIAFELALIGALGLLALFDGMSLPSAEAGEGGGIVGWGISSLFQELLGSLGMILVLFLIMLGFGALSLRGLSAKISLYTSLLQRSDSQVKSGEPGIDHPTAVVVRQDQSSKSEPKPTPRIPRTYRKTFKVKGTTDEGPKRPLQRDERLPPLELLKEGVRVSVTSKEVNLAAGLIEKTLAEFGLPARVIDFRTGPAVTQFALEPGYIESVNSGGDKRRQKVRVSQISALASDLALALSAPTLRIEAPVPGRAYMGIEVPNRHPELVHLRPILESEAFQSVSSPLAIALGRDVAGAAISADLALMPHLLIAGTTGSGKSVCITLLAATLAFENSPEDLRLVLIDPKMVELIRFNGLPHLLGKVETDLERIIGVLRWCTIEMDRRYRLLEEAKARDIDAYNHRVRRRRHTERLPRIVIMIDELADLMMMAPDQTERTLVRLAQMARAVGIHLVLATQRPSTDILTGLIKANFPARISFAVASSVDSRVILDTTGAETLLGKGDMLFLSPEAGVPVRLQGVFVGDIEIERLINYWQEEAGEDASMPKLAPWEDVLAKQAALVDRDEILEQAIELVKRRQQASASMLQRALRVGYPRAARLMDELEELGIIGRPQTGGRTREVLIGKDEDHLSLRDE